MLWPVTAYAAESTDSESPLERLARRGWWFLLILGIAAVVIGLVVLIWPSQTLRVVGVLFGIYLLVSGVMEILLAFVPGLRGGARFLSALTGVLSILLGLLSFRGAAESILLLALWIGFGWLIVGISRAVAAGSTPYLPFRGWQIFGGILLAIGGIIIIVAPFQLDLRAGGVRRHLADHHWGMADRRSVHHSKTRQGSCRLARVVTPTTPRRSQLYRRHKAGGQPWAAEPMRRPAGDP